MGIDDCIDCRLVLIILFHSWTAYGNVLLELDQFLEEFMINPVPLTLDYEMKLIWIVMMQLT